MTAKIHFFENKAIRNVKPSSLIISIVVGKIRTDFLLFDVVCQVDFDCIRFFLLIYESQLFSQLSGYQSDLIFVVLSLGSELTLLLFVELVKVFLCGVVSFDVKHLFAELLSLVFELIVVYLDQFASLGLVIPITHVLQLDFLLVESGESQDIFKVVEC